jgi:enterochelin esterase-like enzyme
MIVDKIITNSMSFNKKLIQIDEESTISKVYSCPRGHTFTTNNPIVIAVDGDSNYNSGPICGYCYVDWFKVNLNANEERGE